MAVAVLGGMGFIGRRVVANLLRRGEQVVCFSRQPDAAVRDALGDQVVPVQGDITSLEDVSRVFQMPAVDRAIDLVYMLTSEAEERLHEGLRVNVMGTANVFEAAQAGRAKRVVFTSSMLYHGPQGRFGDRRVNEDDRAYPEYAFAAEQWLCEFMAGKYADLRGLEPVTLRIPVAFGPWAQQPACAPPWFKVRVDMISKPALGMPVHVPFRPDQPACMIYVDDVAEMLVRLALLPALKRRTYHAGGASCLVGDVAGIVRDLIPDAAITLDERAFMHEDLWLIDNSRICDDIGLRPRTLREGVCDHINQVRRSAGLPEVG